MHGGAIAARETVGVVRAGYQAGSANEAAALNLFVAFGVTFVAARAVTHSIRRGVGPLRNVRTYFFGSFSSCRLPNAISHR